VDNRLDGPDEHDVAAAGHERGEVVGEPDGPNRGGRGIDRRAFIAGAGALTGAVALDHIASGAVLPNPFRVAPGPAVRNPLAVNPRSLLANPLVPIKAAVQPTFTLILRRREDLLFLRIDGYNLVRKGQKLVRKDSSQDAQLVITFGPQHLTEQAFFETATNSGSGNESPGTPGNSAALLAAPSRLAFTLPPGHSIPLTIAGLLTWSKLQPSLVPVASYVPPVSPIVVFAPIALTARRHHRANAVGPPSAAHLGGAPPSIVRFGGGAPPSIRAPEPTETSLELPWHVALSPTNGGKWSHPTQPLTANGSTELWHTRLAKSTALTASDGGALRAVWNFDTQTFDYAHPGAPTLNSGSPPPDAALGPFRTSLTPNDRYQIVKLTSDFSVGGRADITADKLWLSARGGFLDSNGIWDDPHFSLVQWKHLATGGRDQYVKVVKKGFLFPFGHRVVEVTITERQFEAVGGQIVATSRQIVYLVVRQPLMSYDPSVTFGVADNSRDFPFRSLECKTLRTPQLDQPLNFVSPLYLSSPSPGFSGVPFVPTVSGTPFKWHFVGTDWVGRHISFTAQAVFVIYEDGVAPGTAAAVRNAYNARDPSDAVRTASFGGKAIAFAQSLKTGDTDLQVKSMSFGAGPGAGGTTEQFEEADHPQCYPTLSPSINGSPTGAQAVVRLASAEQASGGAPLHGNSSPAVAYYPPYVTTGFSTSQQPTGNAGNVYMEILSTASNSSNIVFGDGSSGGVLTPNLELQGISRSLGPVADLDNIFSGKFDPGSIFQGLSSDLQATILGGVKLADLLAPVTSFLDGGTPEIPNAKALRITYETDGTVVTTNVTWKPDIVTDNPIVTPRGGGTTTSFELDATITTDLAHPTNSNFTIAGTLKNFVVNLMSTGDDQFIKITFDELTFTSASGQKANVNVQIHAVEFVGPLKFVQQLQSFMDFSGDGGPKIQLLPTGIKADIAVKLPTIAVGLFSLSNIAIVAGFMLPWDGSAEFDFGFSTKSNPFQLSCGIFGGGGYFGIGLTVGGVKEIDAGFDFGAMCAINLGVASGSVSLVAGFQFTYDVNQKTGKHTCILTGYVKLQGSLSILGIVTMSLTFDLSLTYEEPPSSVTGTATVTLSISILFIHFSVSATATKTFTNNGTGGGSRLQNGRSSHAVLLASTPPTFADQMTFADWQTYCQAFGTYAPAP
jgi:hypothetical protein